MAGSPKKRARRQARESECRALVVVPPPEPEKEPQDRWGRPWGKWRPEFVEIARTLCEEGITDKELAKHLGINRSTLYAWHFAHPEFAEAMKIGKAPADDRMERRAYEIAMGYTMTVKETIKLRDNLGNEVLREIEKEVTIPPNTEMLKWLLKNRKPDVWRDKTEVGVSGTVVHLTAEQARERLKAAIQNLLEKPAEEPKAATG